MKLIKINKTTRQIGRFTADFLDSFREGPLTVNLGVGTPTLAAEYIKKEDLFLHSENGLLGLGPLATGDEIDPDLVNAAMEPATALPGASYTDLCNSFALIRGGHIDVVVLGAFEVSEDGNIANWTRPGKTAGVGGAMDLACCAGTLVVAMSQTNKGGLKLVRKCSLPITAFQAVDYVITERGILHRTETRWILEAMAENTTADQIRSEMEFDFIISSELRILFTGEEASAYGVQS